MAVVPQRRTSKTRKRLRRSHHRLELPGMMVCSNCGEMKLAHVVCKECGYYDGRLVRAVKVKDGEEQVVEEQTDKKSKRATRKAKKKKEN